MSSKSAAFVTASRMQEVGYTFHTFKLAPGAIGPGHLHHYAHMMVLHRGKIRLVVDGVESIFDAADKPHYIYIDKDKRHAVQAIEGEAVYTCQFRWRDEFDKFVDELSLADPRHAAARIEELFNSITRHGCGDCDGCG